MRPSMHNVSAYAQKAFWPLGSWIVTYTCTAGICGHQPSDSQQDLTGKALTILPAIRHCGVAHIS